MILKMLQHALICKVQFQWGNRELGNEIFFVRPCEDQACCLKINDVQVNKRKNQNPPPWRWVVKYTSDAFSLHRDDIKGFLSILQK